MEGYNGEKILSIYTNFLVGPESDNYTLQVTGYLDSSIGGLRDTFFKWD